MDRVSVKFVMEVRVNGERIERMIEVEDER